MSRVFESTARLPAFLAIAFGFSWACWLPASFAAEGFASSWARWLAYAGTLGPAVAGIALTYGTGDTHAREDYWARATDFARIRPRWWLLILLLYPLATSIALLFDSAVTGIAPDLQMARGLLSRPWSLIVFAGWVLLLGPLPEELGWRGYALDVLQHRSSPFMSSIILGSIWAIWHLPLFFIDGSYQHHLGFGSLSFWSYVVTIVELSILFTWIYNHNGRSTLAAIVFHFVLNLSGSLARGSPVSEVAKAIVLGIAVAIVVIAGRDSKAPRARNRAEAKSGST